MFDGDGLFSEFSAGIFLVCLALTFLVLTPLFIAVCIVERIVQNCLLGKLL